MEIAEQAFTDQMPFQSLNQQCPITESTIAVIQIFITSYIYNMHSTTFVLVVLKLAMKSICAEQCHTPKYPHSVGPEFINS